MADQAKAMDNMYRYQRHFYDLTRKYYLLGRDLLIREMQITATDQVLEMGCGTARNLMLLAKKHSQTQFYGLDASQEMLNTSIAKVSKKPYAERLHFQQCLAEQLNYQTTFGLEKPFDVIFFSYALSMIPPWEAALQTAVENLKPQGHIYIVDFCDQQALPAWFRGLLTRWLALFGVHYPPDLLPKLEAMQAAGIGTLEAKTLWGRYAFIAKFQKH